MSVGINPTASTGETVSVRIGLITVPTITVQEGFSDPASDISLMTTQTVSKLSRVGYVSKRSSIQCNLMVANKSTSNVYVLTGYYLSVLVTCNHVTT